MTQVLFSLEDRAGDLKGRLPAQARARFEALEQAAADAHALLLAASAAAREARDDLRDAEAELDRPRSWTPHPRRDEAAETRAAARVEAERVEVRRRTRIAADREAAWHPIQS